MIWDNKQDIADFMDSLADAYATANFEEHGVKLCCSLPLMWSAFQRLKLIELNDKRNDFDVNPLYVMDDEMRAAHKEWEERSLMEDQEARKSPAVITEKSSAEIFAKALLESAFLDGGDFGKNGYQCQFCQQEAGSIIQISHKDGCPILLANEVLGRSDQEARNLR